MKKLTIYESDDGYQWESEEACKEWETLLPLLERAKKLNSRIRYRLLYKLGHPVKNENGSILL